MIGQEIVSHEEEGGMSQWIRARYLPVWTLAPSLSKANAGGAIWETASTNLIVWKTTWLTLAACSRIQTWALEEARRRLEAEGILEDPDKKN